MSPEFVEHLFTEGRSTKPDSGIPGGRGIGLALSRQIARALSGELRLASPRVRSCPERSSAPDCLA